MTYELPIVKTASATEGENFAAFKAFIIFLIVDFPVVFTNCAFLLVKGREKTSIANFTNGFIMFFFI